MPFHPRSLAAFRLLVPLALSGAAIGASCTSAPIEVESRRRQREDADAEARNADILARLRESASRPDGLSLALVRSVEDLVSSDFVRSTTGERALVEAGRAALPVLAAASGLTVSVLGSRVDPIAAMVNEIHRRDSVTRLLTDLGHESPVIRESAAEILAERGEVQAIPSLVARLRDPEPRVCAAFAMAVSRLSRRYFGPFDVETIEEREALARRIESWFLFPTNDRQGSAFIASASAAA